MTDQTATCGRALSTGQPCPDHPTAAPTEMEQRRLALSEALGLGTGAPWDTITKRVAEMATQDGQLHDDLTGTRLSLWEEEQDTARLRLALKSAQRGRHEARARIAKLEAQAATARATTLREAADIVHSAFHGEPFLNYPEDFADLLREKAAEAQQPSA